MTSSCKARFAHFMCKMKKISDHFRPVRDNRHVTNVRVEDDVFELQSEEQKSPKQKRKQESEDCMKASKEAVEEIRLNAAAEETAVQVVNEEINSVINCLDADEAPIKKRILHARPTNWAIIAEGANIYGNYSTIRTYQAVFSNASSVTSNKRLSRWRKDLKDGKQPNQNKYHLAYSSEIDKELFEAVLVRRSEGGPSVDNSILREMLLAILTRNDLMGLLRENGGNNTFGDSWSHRFFERHNLVSRVCTTKIRKPPADLEDTKSPNNNIARLDSSRD